MGSSIASGLFHECSDCKVILFQLYLIIEAVQIVSTSFGQQRAWGSLVLKMQEERKRQRQ